MMSEASVPAAPPPRAAGEDIEVRLGRLEERFEELLRRLGETGL